MIFSIDARQPEKISADHHDSTSASPSFFFRFPHLGVNLLADDLVSDVGEVGVKSASDSCSNSGQSTVLTKLSDTLMSKVCMRIRSAARPAAVLSPSVLAPANRASIFRSFSRSACSDVNCHFPRRGTFRSSQTSSPRRRGLFWPRGSQVSDQGPSRNPLSRL